MRVLVVKLSSLGDVVQTMPVVHDLLRAFPEVQVDWVVEEAFAPLVERVVGVSRVVPTGDRRWRKTRRSAQTRAERRAFQTALQAEAYDAVLDCQGLLKSVRVAQGARIAEGGFSATFGNASEACGYEWPVRFFVSRTVPMPRRVHAVERTRLLAANALGYERAPVPVYELLVADRPRVRAVVLAHGTTRPDNEWHEIHWRELGRRLAGEGFQVWLPQSNDLEQALAERLAAAIGPQAVIWPRLSLAEVLDTMAQSCGVIGVDSGLSHMAVALDLPHVQLFSQPRAWRAGPVGRAHQVAVGGDAPPDLDTVWDAWHRVWSTPPGPA